MFADFEKSFDYYLRSGDVSDLKSCIANANKYVEGLAGMTCGRVGTLGELAKEMKDWPHKSVLTALGNLYGFCSDYPGIRHAGNPQGQLRELSARDIAIISMLLMTYSGYLSPLINESSVLGV